MFHCICLQFSGCEEAYKVNTSEDSACELGCRSQKQRSKAKLAGQDLGQVMMIPAFTVCVLAFTSAAEG